MSSLFNASAPNSSGHRDVRPEQLYVDTARTRLVDVREADEFVGELGHIRRAELVALATLDAACEEWNRDDAIVLICRSGRRSERGATMLTAKGFTRVMNMVGGMLAWNDARFPVEGASTSASENVTG